MASSTPAQGADPEDLQAPSPSLPDRRVYHADPEDLRLDGAVCRFEHVAGAGDAEIARLAELQHGHVHVSQLRAAGITRTAVAHRVRAGRLHLVLPSVYLVGRPARDQRGRMMAAALHFKGDGLVTARAAASLWGQLDSTAQFRDDELVDILLVGRNARGVRGVRIRRAASLERQDIRWRHGIPVTSPALTVLYLARTCDDLELEAAAAMAFRRNGLRVHQLRDVVDRNPRAKGVARVRALIDRPESLRDTRSRYERKLLRLIAAAELPAPITNRDAAGHMVDLRWPDLKLVAEFDGWEIHNGRAAFETDRLRDQDLAAAAHQVFRITAWQIDHAPYALVARLSAVMTALRLAR